MCSMRCSLLVTASIHADRVTHLSLSLYNESMSCRQYLREEQIASAHQETENTHQMSPCQKTY
jgi:hypothetical protein